MNGEIPVTDFVVRILENSALSKRVSNGFDGCDVVWAIWGPEDDDGASEHPTLRARVIRGRDRDPDMDAVHGAVRVDYEVDAFDLQANMGDERVLEGGVYVDDDHVPEHWARFLEEAVAEERERETARGRH